MIKQLFLFSFLFLSIGAIQAQNNGDQLLAYNDTYVGKYSLVDYGLTLSVSNVSTTKGAEVCVDVSTKDFDQIVSLQYSMAWNSDLLKFKEVKNFKLPAMNAQNFGAHKAENGVLTFAWYDPNIRGITLPDDSVIYQVCFEAIGKSGSIASLKFANEPTVQEVSNASGELIPLNSIKGRVKVD